jgi:hypothetical protein
MELINKIIKITGEEELATIKGKILFQKIALLASMESIQECPYKFQWSLYGPYSSSLAEDLSDCLARNLGNTKFAPDNDFLLLTSSLLGKKLEDFEVLELLVSYKYVQTKIFDGNSRETLNFLEQNPRKDLLLKKIGLVTDDKTASELDKSYKVLVESVRERLN